MGPLGGHLPYVEGVADHEVVDGVGAAEVEAEGLQGPQPPDVEHLALFGDLARFVVAVVMLPDVPTAPAVPAPLLTAISASEFVSVCLCGAGPK